LKPEAPAKDPTRDNASSPSLALQALMDHEIRLSLMNSDSPERYWVRLAKENMVFSAAHFITFAGDVCERLHGHNYRVAAYVYGPLDENQYVVDFIALRDSLLAILGELDHHMLLPTDHAMIQVTAGDQEVLVRFAERRWVFPRGDCVLLPVSNTTAELLARYIGKRLIAALEGVHYRPEKLRLEVDENSGQWGCWEVDM
jgi:6-pyruvoyltetrahydropterin/6-carboxytetrahydropterin synthase